MAKKHAFHISLVIFAVMESKIKYIRKIPSWKVVIGIAGLGVGLFGLISLNIYGLVPLLFGFMMLKSDGSEIDLEANQYRKLNVLMGFCFGKWQALESPEYVSVFNTTEDITVRALTAETSNSFPIIVLNLFHHNNQKLTVYKTKDIKDAFNVASHIADALLIDLLDATEKNDFKWVDKDILRKKGELVYID